MCGVDRFVLTSSSATLGASENGTPRTEADFAPEGRSDGYHHSKVEQERAAFAGRVPVIALLPTAPVGPGDWKPTPTGQMIRDFARGKMFAKPPRGGLNLVPVEDVARAHVAALREGKAGDRYILGGENVLLDQVWQLLSEVTGKAMPRWRAPDTVALGIAAIDELRCRIQKNAQPFVPLEGVRMARERMFADSSKAARDLSFRAGPVREALERAVRWYRTHGYAGSRASPGGVTIVAATSVEARAARRVAPANVRVVEAGIALQKQARFDGLAISCGLAGDFVKAYRPERSSFPNACACRRIRIGVRRGGGACVDRCSAAVGISCADRSARYGARAGIRPGTCGVGRTGLRGRRHGDGMYFRIARCMRARDSGYSAARDITGVAHAAACNLHASRVDRFAVFDARKPALLGDLGQHRRMRRAVSQ